MAAAAHSVVRTLSLQAHPGVALSVASSRAATSPSTLVVGGPMVGPPPVRFKDPFGTPVEC
jgi:hypothetical protein